VARRVVECLGVALLAGILGGCGPAQSNEGGKSIMLFGLFKSKYTTTVRPEVGGALKRESTFPTVSTPPVPPHLVVRNAGIDAPPPGGKLAKGPQEQPPPGEAFIIEASGSFPAVALVNTYGADLHTEFWEINGDRFGKPRAATFDPNQAKWSMWSSRGVVPLPAGRVFFHLKYHDPIPRDGVFLYNIATDRVRSLGRISPDWWRGLPLRFVSSLQVRADAVLVRYSSEQERIGPQRYVNHFDHLVLFSPKHPDGLEIVKLGLDDGGVRGWGMVGSRLWLETSDEREAPARAFVWSLDLGPAL